MDAGGKRGTSRTFRSAAIVALAAVLLCANAVIASAPVADARSAAPRAGAYPADYFGISAGEDLTQLSDSAFAREVDLMQAAGVHWLRIAIPWQRVQHIQTFPPKWELIDRLVQAASSHHMQILAIVDNPPPWAEQNVPHISCAVQPPFNLTEYASFVGQLAARYPASVLSAIELENSPNLGGIWKKPDPCAYTQLMRQAYPAIKKANAAIKVLNGGLGGTKNNATSIPGDVFFAAMYKYGAKNYFDIASVHPYSYPCFPSQKCTKARPWYRLPIYRDAMVKNGDASKKMWATEFGAPTNGTSRDGHVDEKTQALIIADGLVQWHKLSYAGSFFVFTFRDHGTNPNVKSDWFGMVTNNLGRLKPSYSVYQKLARGAAT